MLRRLAKAQNLAEVNLSHRTGKDVEMSINLIHQLQSLKKIMLGTRQKPESSQRQILQTGSQTERTVRR